MKSNCVPVNCVPVKWLTYVFLDWWLMCQETETGDTSLSLSLARSLASFICRLPWGHRTPTVFRCTQMNHFVQPQSDWLVLNYILWPFKINVQGTCFFCFVFSDIESPLRDSVTFFWDLYALHISIQALSIFEPWASTQWFTSFNEWKEI